MNQRRSGVGTLSGELAAAGVVREQNRPKTPFSRRVGQSFGTCGSGGLSGSRACRGGLWSEVARLERAWGPRGGRTPKTPGRRCGATGGPEGGKAGGFRAWWGYRARIHIKHSEMMLFSGRLLNRVPINRLFEVIPGLCN